MIPHFISLSGFGPHRDTHVDLTGGRSFALLADNGTGKTFVLEAIIAALYGVYPSRPGPLVDRLTTGGDGIGEIRFGFEDDGEEFLAARIVSRTKPQEAFLFAGFSDDKDAIIAGPKVKDFEAAIVARFGDKKTAMATWIAAQKSPGDLCEGTPAFRREVFRELIGATHLDGYADACNEAAKSCELEAGVLEGQASEDSLEALQSRRGELSSQIKSDEERVPCLNIAIKALRAGLEYKRSELKTLVGDLATNEREAQGKLDLATSKHERAVEAWESAEADAKRLAVRVEQLEEAASAECKVTGAKESRSVLQEKLTRATEAKAGRTKRNAEIARKNAANQRERDKHEGLLQIIEKRLAGLKETKANRPQPLFGEDKCATCPVLAALGDVDAEIEAQEARRVETEGLLNAVPEDEPEEEPCELELLEAELARQIESHTATIEKHLPLASELAACEAAVAELEEVRTKKPTLSAAMKDTETEVEAAKNALQIAKDASAAVATKREEIAGSIQSLESELTENEAFLRTLTDRLAAARQELKGIDQREGEIAEKRRKAKGLRSRAANLKRGRECFGPRGVQTILIDDAAPSLERYADEMLRRTSDGRMSVRIITQRVLKSGKIAEDFSILVSIEGQERDFSEASGGEQQMIRTVMRLAVSRWLASVRGSAPEALLADEAFDHLDSTNTEGLAALLSKLDDVAFSLVVTHKPEIAALFPHQIRLERNAAGAVEVVA